MPLWDALIRAFTYALNAKELISNEQETINKFTNKCMRTIKFPNEIRGSEVDSNGQPGKSTPH